MSVQDVPLSYRSIGPYIKVANDFKDHDQVLYYWVLNYALEKALAIETTDAVSKQYLVNILVTLEQMKKEHYGDDSYNVGPVAQCHVEAKALRLFTSADEQDRQGIFNKNVIKSFYTSGLLFDILSLFTKDELEEKLQEAKKYAKWKATEIHNCLKNGKTPQAGPPNKSGEDDELTRELLNLEVNKPQPTPRSTSHVPPPNQFNQPAANFQPPADQNFGWQQPQQQQFGQGYNQQQQSGQGFQQPQSGFPPSQHYHNPQPIHPPVAQPGDVTLDDFIEARKLTKMATSALDYEDSKTAIDFLRKALNVLEK